MSHQYSLQQRNSNANWTMRYSRRPRWCTITSQNTKKILKNGWRANRKSSQRIWEWNELIFYRISIMLLNSWKHRGFNDSLLDSRCWT
jgi:hypothetical protein